MSGDLAVPVIEVSAHCEADLEAEEQETLKSGARTPRPYHHDGEAIHQHDDGADGGYDLVNGHISPKQTSELADGSLVYSTQSGQVSAAASDSGTEADDERPGFVKTLPAPHLRPRKGLKTGESDVNVLLTPSQLDDSGRRLTKDYFDGPSEIRAVSEEERKAEDDKLLKIRLAEFARRTSEVGFMALIIVCVVCGEGIWTVACAWRRELLVHVAIISTLVLVYPVKLSIVDSASQAAKIWQRFRVPASFDPATVLYPTLLPILVALSVSPASAAPILPNIVLGLSSLPQRLFPRSSRLGEMNILHWFTSILPLIVSQNTAWPSKSEPYMPYLLKLGPSPRILPETLACLYPLHHTLLQPLQYLTTTSLLVSELHLLSIALINLLFLAESPQIVILKACLWIGGASMFFCTASVLHWNVVLMRVPRWKFKRLAHKIGKQKTIVDTLRRLTGSRQVNTEQKAVYGDDSDADEDAPKVSIKGKLNGNPLLRVSSLNIPSVIKAPGPGPKSALEWKPNGNAIFPEIKNFIRPRSNTLPTSDHPIFSRRSSAKSIKEQSTNLLWYLNLTSSQALAKKWAYAAVVLAAIIAIILIPVRYYVCERALYNHEPIGWALGYLFGQLDIVRSWVYAFQLEDWIAIPVEPVTWSDVSLALPLDLPLIRMSLGAANTRLLLICYWAPVLLAGLLVVFSLTTVVEVDTRRKVFHGVMVAMMLPSTFIDPCACALALTLILAIFLLLEVIRAGQLLPLGNAIGRFIAPYVDGRDLRGPVVVSHLFLLIGCAVPLWFSLASISRSGGLPWKDWDLINDTREVAMLAGVICVGMGDAAASLFGRRYGRHKWIWVGGKSIEGSAAFAVAVTIGLVFGKAWLVFGGWNDNNGLLSNHLGQLGAMDCLVAWQLTLAKAAFCACGASFMEAVLTGANDNVVVPVALWLLVKGVRL